MPFKTDNIAIECPFMDRRVKLLPCQKEMVIYYFNQGESKHSLSRRFNVSRRLIQFIIDPSKLVSNIEARNDRGGSKIYYKKESHTKAMKEHRNYKHKQLKLK